MTNLTTAQATPAQQLARARGKVRLALRNAEEASSDSAELSCMDFDTLDNISRTLTAALHYLDGLTITLAVMERKTH